MRLLIVIIPFLLWPATTTKAQNIRSKMELHSAHIPLFSVQEATDSNLQIWGVRWSLSNYQMAPIEFGLHAYSGYGNVARASFGLNLAYVFVEQRAHDLKLGLSLSKIYLEDVDINSNQFDPQVGDISFTSWGNEFKPYLEWEWDFSGFSSLFIQTGYRIINGEKAEVTSVQEIPNSDNLDIEWDETFFYSASGFEFGLGLSVHL